MENNSNNLKSCHLLVTDKKWAIRKTIQQYQELNVFPREYRITPSTPCSDQELGGLFESDVKPGNWSRATPCSESLASWLRFLRVLSCFPLEPKPKANYLIAVRIAVFFVPICVPTVDAVSQMAKKDRSSTQSYNAFFGFWMIWET